MKYIILLAFLVTTSIVNAQTDPIQRDSLANADAWKTRVRVSGIKAANQVIADTARKIDWPYCYYIILNPRFDGWILQLSYGILTNPVVTSASTEADIDFTMSTIFAKYSKAFRNDTN